MKPGHLASELKSTWTISGLAALVISIIGELIASPPTLWPEAGDQPVIITFLVTVIVAAFLCSIVAGRNPKRHVTFAWIVPLGLIFTFAYFVGCAQFSCPFMGSRMAIGWTYLPNATDYIAKHPGLSCSFLIGDFIGRTDNIWPRNQIYVTWVSLFAVYIGAVTLLAMTVVRVMQHLRDQDNRFE